MNLIISVWKNAAVLTHKSPLCLGNASFWVVKLFCFPIEYVFVWLKLMLALFKFICNFFNVYLDRFNQKSAMGLSNKHTLKSGWSYLVIIVTHVAINWQSFLVFFRPTQLPDISNWLYNSTSNDISCIVSPIIFHKYGWLLMILAGFYKFITINRHSLTIMNHYNIYIYIPFPMMNHYCWPWLVSPSFTTRGITYLFSVPPVSSQVPRSPRRSQGALQQLNGRIFLAVGVSGTGKDRIYPLVN